MTKSDEEKAKEILAWAERRLDEIDRKFVRDMDASAPAQRRSHMQGVAIFAAMALFYAYVEQWIILLCFSVMGLLFAVLARKWDRDMQAIVEEARARCRPEDP